VRPFRPGDRYAVILKVLLDHGLPEAQIQGRPSGEIMLRPVVQLRSGFQQNMSVIEVGQTALQAERGRGVVLGQAPIAGIDQVFVRFEESAEITQIPFYRLRRVPSVWERLQSWSPQPDEGAAERVRLHMLGRLLERWQGSTGALARLDVDPLPHQLHLVNHILRSGNLNWLIADDVGLGKTIEIGMLLSALRERPDHNRFLIVTPGGLVKQWQEELKLRFGVDDALIYGLDFKINDPRHWRLYPFVIASIDRLKRDEHLPGLLEAPPFDLVIFDEAHRLSRHSYQTHEKETARFRVAAKLRSQTRSFLFLTATPHQGKVDRFHALLELLRPELRHTIIQEPHRLPELLGQCVFRNRKLTATDASGEFLFRGHEAHMVPVPTAPEHQCFERSLRAYLDHVAVAALAVGRIRSLAMGFVITMMRKLAASSPAAIHRALCRRLERLETPIDAEPGFDEEEADERFFEEEAEQAAHRVGGAFFEGERELLIALIGQAKLLLSNDLKLKAFMEQIVEPLVRRDEQARLLIFAEYRATLECVRDALIGRFGAEIVGEIHGSRSMKQRREVVDGFCDGGLRFVVSSEAGGEGLNLHKRCHTLVNYDLPWNPMRLVQRLGRLYRYGQLKRVVMFNLQAQGSLDQRIIAKMYARIEQISEDLEGIAEEYQEERLASDILGGVVSHLDIAEILDKARRQSMSRTEEEIEEALERAKDTWKMQEAILSGAQSFSPEDLDGQLRLGPDHLRAFVLGTLRQLGCQVVRQTHKGRVFRIRLTPELREILRMERREHLEMTVDRAIHNQLQRKIDILDAQHPLLRQLLKVVSKPEFKAEVATAHHLPGERPLFCFLLRMQDVTGQVLDEEWLLLSDEPADKAALDALEGWLKTEAVHATTPPPGAARRGAYEHAKILAEQMLQGRSGQGTIPGGLELACVLFPGQALKG